MCTVSFVNNNGVVIITSNRDEQLIRPSAIAPRNYNQNGKNVIYPKDPKAGGTWFAVDADKTVLVLLNGGLVKHEAAFSYRKSRGLIALDIIYSDSPKDFWSEIDLENIEPFTLVLYQEEKLYELIWDGFGKRMTRLDENKNHIWSSVTLYPGEIRKKRSDWFTQFLKDKSEISPQDMFRFHRNTQDDDTENGLVINRQDILKTLSITQVTIEQNKGIMRHYDLINAEDFSTTFISI
ncbi:NRDE family protein [Flavobacterium sp. MMLR14_040]|uniref:NRDE family protein n=1 Tax=Flavobacterium sp. MMLR14_040 TaxID=3093843 RepID=UPI00298FE4ED|nr:NRDE family protein [Flavobacterium sp. MMLR14_040]MDW8849388.1 NRDE family protein [Flavobacterium sp. MMLR14_040]